MFHEGLIEAGHGHKLPENRGHDKTSRRAAAAKIRGDKILETR
jgi:hypothetical protein